MKQDKLRQAERNTRNLLGAGLALLSLTVSINSASAATALYGNLGTVITSTTSNSVGYLSASQPDQLSAQGFTLSSDNDYDLTSLEFGLGSSGSSSTVARIFSNISGAPGSALATFTLSGTVGPQGIYSFTGSFAAQKSTSYWVVVSHGNSLPIDSLKWYANDTFTQPTSQNASGISYLGTKSQDGASWNTTLPFLSMRVSGETIPEPTSIALTMLASGVMLIRRKR
jgi:hypothetical protein